MGKFALSTITAEIFFFVMIKFVLGLTIIAFSTFCGYFLSAKHRKKKRFFLQFKEFNERFLSEISYCRRPIGDFISQFSYTGEFQLLLHDFLNRLSLNSEEDFLLENSVFFFLNAEEKTLVEDYFLMLGKGDSASQKGYFSAVREKLVKMQYDSEVACKKYGDLYIKMGLLCGLLVLILLI